MNYKYFNKAVGVQNADNMQPASMNEIRDIMEDTGVIIIFGNDIVNHYDLC
jgi:hypothetical protein